MNKFPELLSLSNDELRSIIRDVRNNPPEGWEACRIYDTPRSYEACTILGCRITFAMWTASRA